MTAKNMQHTICKEISYSGIGLHSGKDVLMTFKPAPVNTGIVYVRTDLPGNPEITAPAFEELMNALSNGASFSDAVTAFCREVIYSAQ